MWACLHVPWGCGPRAQQGGNSSKSHRSREGQSGNAPRNPAPPPHTSGEGPLGTTHLTSYVSSAGPTTSGSLPYTGVTPLSTWVRIAQIKDGTSNTYLMGESGNLAGPAYPKHWINAWGWGQNRHIVTTKFSINYDRGMPAKPRPAHCGTEWGLGACLSYGSYHEGGCFMLMADGGVRFVSENLDLNTHRALSTRANNEIVDDEDY